MSCEHVQELVFALLDQIGPAGERQNALAHIESCRECSAHYESAMKLKGSLREMARRPIPAYVREDLRTLAEHERIRRITRVSVGTRVQNWMSSFQIHCQNMMRPVALPVAGGVISAILLFGMWIPDLTATPQNFSSDVSAPIFTDPSLEPR